MTSSIFSFYDCSVTGAPPSGPLPLLVNLLKFYCYSLTKEYFVSSVAVTFLLNQEGHFLLSHYWDEKFG